MSEKKIVLGVMLVSLLLVVGGVVLVTKMAQTGQVQVTPGARAVLAVSSKDWGEIKIDQGVATAQFTVKNGGDQTLKLFNGTTSCACTKAKIRTAEGETGYFGMHAKARGVASIQPGETAEVIAEFDPAYHGPGGIGPIDRTVSITTNDPDKSELVFKMKGVVVR